MTTIDHESDINAFEHAMQREVFFSNISHQEYSPLYNDHKQCLAFEKLSHLTNSSNKLFLQSTQANETHA